jgi:polysaccharide export outer membrane protein
MNQDVQIVDITGRVKAPGEYPLTAPMTVSELVRAAGGGVDDSYPREVEVIRRTIVNGQRREITRSVIDLSNPEAARTLLSPYDTVNVRPIQGWYKTERVQILGEVKLPGEYVIQPNETIESVVRRAGGFTQEAYLPGTIFSREEIRARQQAELARQGQRLKSELLQVQLDYRGSEKADVDVVRVRQLGALLAEELENAQALGRIVIDMEATLSGRAPIALRDGDAITIPRRPAEVTVLGEVSYPTTHLYRKISRTRTICKRAADSAPGPTAVRPSSSASTVKCLHSIVHDQPMPGDVVIVPFKIDRGRGLFMTATIAQIVGQLAITAASFKTIGIF